MWYHDPSEREGGESMTRTYRIDHPVEPDEAAGVYQRGHGVTRTVSYDGNVKVVTWYFPED